MTGCRSAVLTGAAAASLMGLDGFRDLTWDPLWCAPHSVRPQPNLIRVRAFGGTTVIGDQLVAHPVLVLRHLGEQGAELRSATQHDGVSPRDRVELALEHALREGLVTLEELRPTRSWSGGEVLLKEVLELRGDEPAAESYAEVRVIQALRSWGIRCWRQMWIYEAGRLKHRVDLIVPFDQNAQRPERLKPNDGLLLEVDSQEFHVGKFEQDHQRQTTYDLLGFAWTTITPNQLRDSPTRVRRAIEKRLADFDQRPETKRNPHAIKKR